MAAKEKGRQTPTDLPPHLIEMLAMNPEIGILAVTKSGRFHGMKDRPKTEDRIRIFTEMAKKAGLDCPRGRAIYTVSVLENGSEAFERHESDGENSWALERMWRTRLDTARRWESHYDSGGDIRVITRTREQQNARRRQLYQERRARRRREKRNG